MPTTHSAIFVHSVFSTKLRFKLIQDGWRNDLFSYIGATLHEHKSVLLAAGGIEDHVHLLTSCNPTFAISDTMRLIKSNSSRWINENRMIKARFEWQRGYGAFSVSYSQLDKVKQYLAGQREHHRKFRFEEECFSILDKHQISYDPKYVFDDEIVG